MPDVGPTPTISRVGLVLPTQNIFPPVSTPLPEDPALTAIIEPTVTDTPDPTPTEAEALPTPVLTTIGQSVNGSPIEAVRFGNGETTLIFVGGLHAGFAPGSVSLAQQVVEHFSENMEAIPPNISLIVIPNVNPDSPRAPGKLPGRLNGNGVDLNRNWDCRWVPNPIWGTDSPEGLGGTEPFSEPEVRSLANFIMAQDSTAVIFWQARASLGLVSPGECSEGTTISQTLANVYGNAIDYHIEDFEELVNTIVQGDVTNWLDKQGIPAISVLLTDYTASDFDENLVAVEAVINFYANQEVGE
ncbi:MAG: hypothetical protein DHS20C20_31910 [Ardenticatenaceae bacterium]|nr:MAG: hypothetical protein DHS20C20_31910 [Ardenticatenaceae bacterium]